MVPRVKAFDAEIMAGASKVNPQPFILFENQDSSVNKRIRNKARGPPPFEQ
jgi:hypothetical protein